MSPATVLPPLERPPIAELPKELPVELPAAPPPVPTTKPGGIPVEPATTLPPLPTAEPPAQPPALPPVPIESPKSPAATEPIGGLFRTFFDAPLGFTGPSGVVPRDEQTDNTAIPIEDRWRIGFPGWDRYGKGHPPVDDYPYIKGHWWDPFNQNVLKGDYAFSGQNTFLVATATSRTLVEAREVPIPTTPFESTARAFEQPFFGRPNQIVVLPFGVVSVDLFHGDAAFKPVDWRLKLTGIFNLNYLSGQEVGIVSPDIRNGLDRIRSFNSLQEAFFETKIADLGPDYDFVSFRGGNQFFTSDFRGFIFSDTNLAGRLFGNLNQNRQQFNLAFFKQWEKDTNSGLNSFNDRSQQIAIANIFMQDFIWPGYTASASIHYNRDNPTIKFDRNSFLVRPDPVGVFQPHGLDIVYFGFAGDGHINRLNINHAYFFATGHDSLNPLANQAQDVSAHFGAVELSYDRDWVRFRTSYLYASGDSNPNNGHACGFDGIFDDPNFAGGEFSYWQRQSVRLFGVNLTNRGSFFPNLRSSKTQGQSNFVNPGLQLINFGMDFDVTPKCRLVTNANFMWFDRVEPLQTFLFQQQIHRSIGADLSAGIEYRPLLSNNVIINIGAATLFPGRGFHDIYDDIVGPVNPLSMAFMDVILTY